MTKLEIISQLCDVTEKMSKIIKSQQEIIYRERIENVAAQVVGHEVAQSNEQLDRLEYHLRRVCDIDDIDQ